MTPGDARPAAKLSQLWSRISGWKRALAQLFALSAIGLFISVVSPLYLQLAIDQAIARNAADLLLILALGFGGLAAIGAAAELMRSWATLHFGTAMTFQIVGNLFRHLLRLPAGFFETRHVGDIISRMQSTQPIQKALTQGIVAAVLDGAIAVALAIVLLLYSPILAAICFACTLALVAVSAAMFPRLRARQESELMARAQEQSHLMESIKGAKLIKGAGLEAAREAAWRGLFSGAVDASLAAGTYMALSMFARGLIGGLGAVVVVYVAGRLAMQGAFTIGMIFAFTSYAAQFAHRTDAFITQLVQFRMLELHLSRLADIVGEAEEAGLDGDAPRQAEGHIVLRDVFFRYGAGDSWTLNGVSLEVAPGEFLAITGRSGGGKTTLLKLILGLYPPTQGELLIDGLELEAFGKRAWRRALGVVMQDDTLFSGTIADNIASFDPAPDLVRVQEAAACARVHDDILRQPAGYRTPVGDMGSTLSGGQRQRILLARALYRRPSVLVLDEGTANLDLATERDIADVVAAMPITRIVIAHRPELLRRADRVLVMQAGVLAEADSGPADPAAVRAESLAPS